MISLSPFDTEVTDLRAEIDAIDEEIVALVLRRAQVSRQIQRFRMTRGGVRIDLAREREIVTSYSSRLGRTGVHLATKILLHCRGPLGSDTGNLEQPPDAALSK